MTKLTVHNGLRVQGQFDSSRAMRGTSEILCSTETRKKKLKRKQKIC